MGLYRDESAKECTEAPKREVFRVIDDGTCILTTLDPLKALNALQGLIDKYDITHCWAEAEELK